jgi:hypothetical protein
MNNDWGQMYFWRVTVAWSEIADRDFKAHFAAPGTPLHLLRETSLGCLCPPEQACVTRSGRTSATPGPQGTRQEARSGEGEAHAKVAWQARAGAIGGGSVANLQWRRILRITSAWVMAAMCSGRQGHNPADESPVVPVARFRHVAISQFLRTTLGS